MKVKKLHLLRGETVKANKLHLVQRTPWSSRQQAENLSMQRVSTPNHHPHIYKVHLQNPTIYTICSKRQQTTVF
jgi:hypothetical protein